MPGRRHKLTSRNTLSPIGTASENSRKFELLALALLGFAIIGVSSGPNLPLAILSIIVLISGYQLLRRPSAPPVLLYIFVWQWIQSSLSVFYANIIGLPVNLTTGTGGDMQGATVLSLAGVLFLAIGMRVGAGRDDASDRSTIYSQVSKVDQKRAFYIYIATYLVAVAATLISKVIPGLSQPLLALASLKWAAYLILTIATFSNRNSSRTLWAMVFLFEFVSSIGGYFSSFRSVLIFTFIVLAFSRVRLTAMQSISLFVLGAAAVSIGIYWTAVKPDYRAYLNGGANAQIVTVDYVPRISYLLELLSNVDGPRFRQASAQLVTRVAYVDVLAVVINYVPDQEPFAKGKVLGESVARVFMPRILFPSKTVIDESNFTNKYTGLGVAGMGEGTQISVGYMGDAYIDFGPTVMMFPIFLIGTFLGFVQRWFLRHGKSGGLVGFAISASIIVQAAGDLGNSSAKLFGGLVVAVLVGALVQITLAASLLAWASRKPSRGALR